MNYTRCVLLGGVLLSAVASVPLVAATPRLDDATAFAIFDQATTADIWTGRLGVKYGESAQVRDLAKMVVTEHEAVQQMGREWAKQAGVMAQPPANDASAQNLANAIATLQSKSGREFDEAYLRHEMAFHQSVIDTIKASLLPAVQNAEFKALMEKLLPNFEHHLAATKEAARTLGIP